MLKQRTQIKKMKSEIRKNAQLQLIHNLSFLFLFCGGMAAGVILTSYLRNILVYLERNEFFLSAPSNHTNYTTAISTLPPVTASRPPRIGLKEYLKVSENAMHDMEDNELLWRASVSPGIDEYPFHRVPKVAFMFLTKGPVVFAALWEMFFKGHEDLYSIYVHSSPSYNASNPESPVFRGRRIRSKPVTWGKVNMIDAERRLLASALLDISNERFILLSEACIPLFNFTTIYNYLINSNQSFIESYDDPTHTGRGRYNKAMSPTITLSDWRKSSQWFEVHRNLALKIVSDVKYYPIFRDYCKPPCYADEHYLPTLVTKHWTQLNSNRTITWVDWTAGGAHPRRYMEKDISEPLLNSLRNGSNCTYNGAITTVCFLFARKFHPNTLQPLLRVTPPLLGFNS